jgi:hypothetical protein
MQGGLTMTTIATIGRPVADSWQITVGGGWTVVMLIGMAICFVAMFASMSLMRGGHGWTPCGFRSPQDTTRTDSFTGTPARRPGAAPGLSDSEAGR